MRQECVCASSNVWPSANIATRASRQSEVPETTAVWSFAKMPKQSKAGTNKRLRLLLADWRKLKAEGRLDKRDKLDVEWIVGIAAASEQPKIVASVATHGPVVGATIGFQDDGRFKTESSQCFRLVFEDGASCSVSCGNLTNYTLDPEKAPALDAKWKKMDQRRLLIGPQILEFRRTAANVCARCTCILTADAPGEVDHMKEFSVLSAEFDDMVARGKVKDSDAAWIQYHKRRAMLQRLCKECHHRKSKAFCVSR